MTDHHHPHHDCAKHHAQMEELKAQAEQNLAGWQRAKADYLNLKKDQEKERLDLVKFANASLLLELLPFADTFDRALAHQPKDLASSDWGKGITGLHQQLQTILASLGLERVEATGPFNPEFHEAVSHEPKEGVPSGNIIDVVEQGYLLHGRLLRPAKVKVAR